MTKNQEQKALNEQEVTDDQNEQAPEPANPPIEEKAEINQLLDEGYSVKQIIDLGFNRRTVYHYAKQRVTPENEPSGNHTGPDETAKMPGNKGKHELMKIGSKDMIPPEAVVEIMRFPQDGDSLRVWQDGYISGMWSLLAGARYSQLCGAGQADVITSQLDLWRASKESSKDIAYAAAHQTALEVANFIDQKMPRQEPSRSEPTMADRMFGPMADMAGRQMANMFSRMFGGMFGMAPSEQPGQPGQEQASQFQVPSGWKYKSEEGE